MRIKGQMRRRAAAIKTVVFAALSAGAAHAHDFHLALDKCKIVIGSTVDPAHPPAVVAGDTAAVSCTRSGMTVSCDWIYAPSAKSNQAPLHQMYRILVDSPPELWFSSETRSDFFVVNTTMHAAVAISRIVNEVGAGSKVCSGTFLTDDELRNGLPSLDD